MKIKIVLLVVLILLLLLVLQAYFATQRDEYRTRGSGCRGICAGVGIAG